MQIITGDNVSKVVDYSFGDHFSLWDKTLPGAFTKMANAYNEEFLTKAKEFEGKVMTLYIDNLRLYPRQVKTDTDYDRKFVDFLMLTNNLIALCSLLPNNKFIIYTGQEDTPLDEYIRIPPNILAIYAVNALFNDDIVHPFPFGLQRQMNSEDKRLEIMKTYLGFETLVEKIIEVAPDWKSEPEKLLYINMSVARNPEREPLKSFETNNWLTTRFDDQSKFFPYDKYQDFLNELKNHKFVACPPGHGMDTHRIWETLYMHRVPVMKRHPYFEKLLSGFPVLYVNNWYEVTHALLEDNDHLYQQALSMDLGRLDLEKIMQAHKERHAHQ